MARTGEERLRELRMQVEQQNAELKLEIDSKANDVKMGLDRSEISLEERRALVRKKRLEVYVTPQSLASGYLSTISSGSEIQFSFSTWISRGRLCGSCTNSATPAMTTPVKDKQHECTCFAVCV